MILQPHPANLSHTEWELESLTVQEQPLAQMHPYIEEKYYSEEEDADEELEYLDSNPAIEFIVTVQRRSGVYTWVVFAPISGYILNYLIYI